MCINRTKNLVLKLNKTLIKINHKIKKLINGQTLCQPSEECWRKLNFPSFS